MAVVLNYTMITVGDVEEALGFYRDALGFEVRNDVASGGSRWVTLSASEGPDIVLTDPQAGRSQTEAETIHELLVKGSLPPVFLRTDDLDDTFERARAAGAEVLQEPIEQPWGPRDCAFRDPSGNTVRISQSA
ncbi:MAG TPA: VOC family protein [Amnibacterium sp.]|jgi:catechol 2,3-dioxygenase-like lactoylglutathione lyase family enzyme|nr:VOC family protein [Amnibacterium sp.]